jgi:hypothetical protein
MKTKNDYVRNMMQYRDRELSRWELLVGVNATGRSGV